MALGALQLDAQEQPGGAGGQVFRLVFVDLQVDQGGLLFRGQQWIELPWVLDLHGGPGREQFLGPLLVGHVVAELAAEPLFHLAGEELLLLVVAGRHDGLPPDGGEVVDVIGTGQQFIDEDAAFVGVLALEEAMHLGDRRDASGQVEVDAAEELGVIGQGSGLDLVGLAAGLDQLIDAEGQVCRFRPRRIGPGRGGRQRSGQHGQAQQGQQGQETFHPRSCHETGSF